MLKRIKLTNFQKHEKLEVDFGLGLTALRAANEAGKSTLLRAVCYALFGAKGVKESLDDLVTWDQPVNTLKVELEFELEGVVYTVVRGKSGAELRYPGASVTGQTETAKFISTLLDSDAATATKLILANQGEIRGALAGGAAATTELIEKLAQMGQLDDLIEKLQARLATGSTAAAESEVASAQEALDAAAQLEPPDFAGMQALLKQAEAAKGASEKRLIAQVAANQEARKLWEEAVNAQVLTAQVQAKVQERKKALLEREAELNNLLSQVESIQSIDESLENVNNSVQMLQACLAHEKNYNLIAPLLAAPPGVSYKGTWEALEADISEEEARMKGFEKVISGLTLSIGQRQALIFQGSCTACGKDVSEVPEVKAKNDALKADIQALEATKSGEILALEVSRTILESLQETRVHGRPRHNAWLALMDCKDAEVNVAQVPYMFKWLGASDFAALKSELEQKQAQLSEARARERKSNALADSIAREQQNVQNCSLRLAEIEAEWAAVENLVGPDSVDALKRELDACEALVRAHRMELTEATSAQQDAEWGLKQSKVQWALVQQQAEAAKGMLAKRKHELASLVFNNELIKRVRAARPLIADRLWSLVLGAVSRYFSEMRGTASAVTKSSDGFRVDGHPVSTLSGSTLDILGLAIRVALVRTFMPQASLLVLDEPTAAMDAERTTNLLGFLATTGFRQTIVVSHEDATESVADHLITL